MRSAVLFSLILAAANLTAGEDLAAEIIKLGAPDAAMRDSAMNSIAVIFKESAGASKRPYARELFAQVQETDAAKREAVLKSLVEAFDALRRAVTQQQSDALKQIASGDAEQRKKGLEFFVEGLNNVLERAVLYAEIEKLGSPDPKVVEAAQKTLLNAGEDGAPYLASSLDDENAQIKRQCYELLRTLGPLAKSASNDLQFLLDSDDKSARRAAGSLLEGLGPNAVEVVDDLVMYLEHDEKSVRRSAANILKKIGAEAKEAADDIADLLDEDDKHLRSIATEVLINMGPAAKGALETLAGMVNEPNNEPDVRERAASVLASMGKEGRPVLDILKKNLADTNPQVKAAIEAAIKSIETP